MKLRLMPPHIRRALLTGLLLIYVSLATFTYLGVAGYNDGVHADAIYTGGYTPNYQIVLGVVALLGLIAGVAIIFRTIRSSKRSSRENDAKRPAKLL